MAKYRCKVCGQTFEADTKPEKCPICGAAASEIELVEESAKEAPKKKGFDTNSNTYTIVYSTIIVIIVAFLLAFVASALKPQQDANVRIDTMQHKLNALNIRSLDKSQVEEKYSDLKVGEAEKGGVVVEQFAVDGSTKYLVPVSGRGLWGGISGYIALDDDMNTIFGTDFQHESETAGLGALIAEQPFQDSFRGKQLVAEGDKEITLSVVKKGKQGSLDPKNYVDGVTGATLTSEGVNAMLKDCLKKVVFEGGEEECDGSCEVDGKCTNPHPCAKCKERLNQEGEVE